MVLQGHQGLETHVGEAGLYLNSQRSFLEEVTIQAETQRTSGSQSRETRRIIFISMIIKHRGLRKREWPVFRDLPVVNCGPSREQKAKSLIPSLAGSITPSIACFICCHHSRNTFDFYPSYRTLLPVASLASLRVLIKEF